MKSQKEIHEEAKRRVLDELNMTESTLDHLVENVKTWLNHQPHLPHIIDDAVIRSFIVHCKSVEVAKERLNKYFMSRINIPSELDNRDPRNIQWDKTIPMVYLPDLTPEGYSVLFVKTPDLNESPDFDFLQTVRLITMMWEIMMRENPYITNQIYLNDFKHASLKLASKISCIHTMNVIYLLECIYPVTMQKMYNYNTPPVADVLQRTLAKPFMSDGMYNRIHSYTEDVSILEKHIPMEILPQDYGGKAPKLKDLMNDWKIKLEKYRHIFTEECSHLPDKSKIPKALLDSSNFGSSGTFRKLDVD